MFEQEYEALCPECQHWSPVRWGGGGNLVGGWGWEEHPEDVSCPHCGVRILTEYELREKEKK